MKIFQVLFNKPLQFNDKVIYGFRIPYDKDKAKHLMEYAVEWLIGKWCFEQRHGGKVSAFKAAPFPQKGEPDQPAVLHSVFLR